MPSVAVPPTASGRASTSPATRPRLISMVMVLLPLASSTSLDPPMDISTKVASLSLTATVAEPAPELTV